MEPRGVPPYATKNPEGDSHGEAELPGLLRRLHYNFFCHDTFRASLNRHSDQQLVISITSGRRPMRPRT